MLDYRLIHAINTGRCFALVGAGPSSELGYPSWQQLAESVFREVTLRTKGYDRQTYERFLSNNQYAELLGRAERDLGGREALIQILRPILTPGPGRSSSIYDIHIKWPFACYLTPTFADELPHRL